MADDDTEKSVPLATLEAERRARKAANEALAQAQARVSELESQVTSYEGQAKAWQSTQAQLETLTAERATWQLDRELLVAGMTDPEGLDLARLAYGRVEEAARPKGGISEWVKAQKWAAAYLPAATTTTQTTGGQTGAGATAPARGAADAGTAAGRGLGTGTSTVRPVHTQTREEIAASRDTRFRDLGAAAPSYPWQRKAEHG